MAKSKFNRMDKEKISFIVSIGETDWDEEIGGWRCPALKVPTSSLDAFFASGEKVDDRRYQVHKPNAMIIWANGRESRPHKASLSISINEPLISAADATKAVTSAQDDLSKSQANADKWKKLAIVLPFLASILGVILGFVSDHFDELLGQKKPPLALSSATTLQQEMNLTTWMIDDRDTFVEIEVGKVLKDCANTPDGRGLVLKFELPEQVYSAYKGFGFKFGQTFYQKLGGEKLLPELNNWTKWAGDDERFLLKYDRKIEFSINYKS